MTTSAESGEQPVELPFTGGLNEKENPFKQDPSTAARMDNLVRVKTGEARVRAGWPTVGDLDVAEDSTQIVTHRDRVYGVGPHFIQHAQARFDHVPEFTLLGDVGITGGSNAQVHSSDVAFFNGYWFQVAEVFVHDDLAIPIVPFTVLIVASQFEINQEGVSRLVHERALATKTGTFGKVQIAARQTGLVVVYENGANLTAITFPDLLPGTTPTVANAVTTYDSSGCFFIEANPDVTDDWFIAWTSNGGAPAPQTFATPGFFTTSLGDLYDWGIRVWGSGGGGGGSRTVGQGWQGGFGAAGGFSEVLYSPTGTETINVLDGEGGGGGNGNSDSGSGAAGGGWTGVWRRIGADTDFSGFSDGTTVLTSVLLNQRGSQNWQVDSGGTPTANTGPTNGCNFFTGAQVGGAKYVYCETSGLSGGEDFILETNAFDTRAGPPLIAFNLHAYFDNQSNSDSVFTLEAWNGTSWEVLRQQVGQSQGSEISSFSPWLVAAAGYPRFLRSDFKWRLRFVLGPIDGARETVTNDIAIANPKWGVMIAAGGSGGGGGGAGRGGSFAGYGGPGGPGGGSSGVAGGADGAGHAKPGNPGTALLPGGGGTGAPPPGGGGALGTSGYGGIGGDGGNAEILGGPVGATDADFGGSRGGEGGDTASNVGSCGGGGGGGAGVWAGGGGEGGDNTAPSGGAGGGGGSGYTRPGGTLLAGNSTTPPGQLLTGYVSGHGVGGAGGTAGDGNDGGDGLVYFFGVSSDLNVRRVSGTATPVWTQGIAALDGRASAISLSVSTFSFGAQVWCAFYQNAAAHYARLEADDGAITTADTTVAALDALSVGCDRISIQVRGNQSSAVIAWSEDPNVAIDPGLTRLFRWALVDGGAPDNLYFSLRTHLVSQIFGFDGRFFCWAILQDRQQDNSDPIVANGSAEPEVSLPFGAGGVFNGATSQPFFQGTYVLLDLRLGDVDAIDEDPETGDPITPRLVALAGRDTAFLPESNCTTHVALAPSTQFGFTVSLPRLKELPAPLSPDVNPYSGKVTGFKLPDVKKDTQLVALRHRDTALWRAQEAGPAAILPSALPSLFDGHQFLELPFAHFPEIVAIRREEFTSDLSVGGRRYLACFARHDEYGPIYRSEPSNEVTALNAQPGRLLVKVSQLNVTNWQDFENGYRNALEIELYRTTAENPAGPFYLTKRVLNDPRVSYTIIFDDTPDQELVLNEQLYTGSGELPNNPPPPARYAVAYRNRIILAGTPDGRGLFYSKEFVNDSIRSRGIGFSDFQQLRLEDSTAIVTGLSVQDGALLVWCRDRLFLLHGDFPDDKGQGGSLSFLQQLTTTFGCVDGAFIVSTGAGAFYPGDRGWYLLDRGFADTYISAPVEDTLRAFPVTKFAIKDRDNDWLLIGVTNAAGAEGRILRYDLFHKQWSVDVVNTVMLSAAQRYDGGITLLDVSADLREARDGQGDSTTSPVVGVYETPWYSLAQLSGQFRLRMVYALLKASSYDVAGKSTVTIEYATNRRANWRLAANKRVLAAEAGEGFSMKFKPSPEPLTAVKFRVTLKQANASGLQNGEPAYLTGLRLQVALPPGAERTKHTGKKEAA